jgi:hypothetical protein
MKRRSEKGKTAKETRGSGVWCQNRRQVAETWKEEAEGEGNEKLRKERKRMKETDGKMKEGKQIEQEKE